MPYSSGPGGHTPPPVTLIINIYGLGVGISTIKKFTSGRGWGITPGALAIKQLICLVTLIINIYGLTRQIKCLIAQVPGVIPHPLPEVNFLMVEIPTPKPYIFMIMVIRQIKCLIALKNKYMA
jgi:hypothetical protein